MVVKVDRHKGVEESQKPRPRKKRENGAPSGFGVRSRGRATRHLRSYRGPPAQLRRPGVTCLFQTALESSDRSYNCDRYKQVDTYEY